MSGEGNNLRKVLLSASNGDLGNLLEAVVNRGHIDLYRHLWYHEDFLNMWTVEDFKRLTSVIISNNKLSEQLLEFHLTEGSNHFLALPGGSHERQQLVNSIVQRSGEKALAQSFYSPYLLINLIDKQTFMK